MAIIEISVSKIYVLATEPTKKVKDRFWFDTTNNLLKRYDGTSWKPISVSSDDVVVLSSGNKVSLTNYLNTQIAALAEGIDSKQDKLSYYTEVSGDNPSATISAANIRLTGKVAEGNNTTASGLYSHAEGNNTTASGLYSHAEGFRTTASGSYSHAEGNNTTASSYYSHAEGHNTNATKSASHAEGSDTKASSNNQHVQGKFNIEDANDKYADIIGNGSSGSARSNAATVSWDGISWSQTDVRAGGTDQDNATYSLSALAESKQDKLTFYYEDTSTNQEASIQNANSFSILRTNKGLILDGNNGGITIKNSTFNTGQAVISIAGNSWKNSSDQILFDIDGDSIKMTDAFLIPEIKNKQNSTDTSLNTTDKTIVGAINELLASINANVITSTEQKRITTTSTASGIQMSTTAKACMVSINPVKTNVGAIYISTSSDTAPTINPLYPDQMPKYKFPDASQVYIWSDVNGDSVELTIEYYG